MSTKPPKILDSLRVRVRRFQLTMGLGFIALVIGSIFTGLFTNRLAGRAQELPYFLYVLLDVVLLNLWVLGVLPLICYGAARVLELRPMSTALGAAFTGKFFSLAVRTVSGGVESLWESWLPLTLEAAAFFSGVLLSYRAINQGRAAAAKGAEQVKVQAESRKSEYDEFLREAERAAEKTAQREAERAAAAAASPAPTEPPAPAAAPPSAAPAPEEAPKPESSESKVSTGG